MTIQKVFRCGRPPRLAAACALFAGIIGFQILGPVPIGLADNGDFARILGPLRLWLVGRLARKSFTSRFNYFVNDYIVVGLHVYDGGVPSSEELIARLAKGTAGMILPTPEPFNLRLMGFLHAAILILATLFILH